MATSNSKNTLQIKNGKICLRVQLHLLQVEDQVFDAAMKRLPHFERGCALALGKAPDIQVGCVYCLVFCEQAQLHFHRIALIHLDSDNSKRSKEKTNLFTVTPFEYIIPASSC